MTHTLVLVRHAQAEPHCSGGDHARPLSDHGNEQARTLAGRLARIIPTFNLALYSDARRTTETAEHLLRFCHAEKAWSDRSIYMAGASDILAMISGLDEAETVLIVGHEPTISEVGRYLASDPGMIQRGVPTATALVLRHDEPWAELGAHGCDLEVLYQS